MSNARAYQIDGPCAGLPAGLKHAVHGADDYALLSEQTRRHYLASVREGRSRRALERARVHEVDSGRWEDAKRRLVLGVAARIGDPLPEEVLREVHMRLYAQPTLRLEFVGRGEPTRRLAAEERATLVTLDVPGGRRRYHFRVVGESELDPTKSRELGGLLSQIGAWLDDPDAKLVLSIGGGGYRMFAVTPILKILDDLLGDRSRIQEVWGCSGGAIAAHAYAEGIDPVALDQFAYALYYRQRRGLPDWSVGSVAKLWYLSALDRRRERRPSIQKQWIRYLDELEPPSARAQPRIPFYAIACSPVDRGLVGLAEPDRVSDPIRDLVLPASRDQALAATCAVPFLFPAQRGIRRRGSDAWIDGSVIDENPVVLPFVKWSRERAGSAAQSPKRLKIILIDLNARAGESASLAKLSRIPVVGRYGIKRATRIVDMILDSRSHLASQMLAELPEVDILRLRLSVGVFGVRDRASILKVLLRGRTLSAWDIARVGMGALTP